MEIGSELEKLVSLRERGELSREEFEKAKQALFFRDCLQESKVPSGKSSKPEANSNNGKSQPYLLIAVLSTVAMVFSGGSAMIGPTPLKYLAFALMATASILNWNEFLKRVKRRK